MMGANYRKGNQGKRDDQIRASYVAFGLSLMGVLLTILVFCFYHITKFITTLCSVE